MSLFTFPLSERASVTEMNRDVEFELRLRCMNLTILSSAPLDFPRERLDSQRQALMEIRYCSSNTWPNPSHPLPLCTNLYPCCYSELSGEPCWSIGQRPGSLSRFPVPPPKPRQIGKKGPLVYPSSGRHGEAGTELMR